MNVSMNDARSAFRTWLYEIIRDTWHRTEPSSGVRVGALLYQQTKLYDAILSKLSEQRPAALSFTCGVCWTSSFEPVEHKAQCDLDHPHGGDHARCAMCWITACRRDDEALLRRARASLHELLGAYDNGTSGADVVEHREDAQTAIDVITSRLGDATCCDAGKRTCAYHARNRERRDG